MEDLRETPEQKAERWMIIIRPYLEYAKTPGHDEEYINRARAKTPFLDWVLKNPDVPPALFFYADPPPVIKPPTDEHTVSPGDIASQDRPPAWFDQYDVLLKAIARKLEVLP